MALKKRDNGKHYAILLPINEWQLPVILALQYGATLLRDRNQYGDFEDPRFRQAFLFYLNLFEQGFAPPVSNNQIANIYQEFANGAFAIYISGPWNIGEFGRRLPAAMQNQWNIAPLPAVTDAATHSLAGEDSAVKIGAGWSLAGGASLAISRTSPRREAAWKLLAFLAEPEQQARFYQLTGDLPARQSAWTDPALANNPRLQPFQEQLRWVQTTPPIPEWERIAQRIAHYAELAVRKQLSVDEALAALNQDVDRILEKRRWLIKRGMTP